MHSEGIYQPYMLDERHFAAVIAAAILLHGLAFFAWHISPKTKVLDIPIRTLNVRLGDAEDNQNEQPQPVATNNASVEQLMNKVAHNIKEEKQRQNKLDDSLDKALAPPAKADAAGAKQYVREVNVPSGKKSDLGKGSTARNAEIMSRYTQLISLWIQKFKQYPDDARESSLHGDTIVRIRIDRRGNVRYYALERSTGHPELDRAAIEMIKRANPVPAVPNDYPEGDLLEFLIPVSFSLL